MADMNMMMLMMNITTHDNQSPSFNNNCNNNLDFPLTVPTWKLYENPFYSSHHRGQQQDHHHHSPTSDHHHHSPKQIHKLHLPVSARKIAASFWDLTFIKPFMESELENAQAQIKELKLELERERKARKKAESSNKKLLGELSEERRSREALERVCEEFAKEISAEKAELSRIRREMEEERKMMRTAEVIREERVQMKLADAKILLEEKLSELEISKKMGSESESGISSNGKRVISNSQENNSSFGEKLRFVLREKKFPASVNSAAVVQRKAAPEAENPHIRRGIKGFVEFPKVVRAIGCRSGKHLGSKLECQKAQLKILLKQKGPVRFNGLIAG